LFWFDLNINLLKNNIDLETHRFHLIYTYYLRLLIHIILGCSYIVFGESKMMYERAQNGVRTTSK